MYIIAQKMGYVKMGVGVDRGFVWDFWVGVGWGLGEICVEVLPHPELAALG